MAERCASLTYGSIPAKSLAVVRLGDTKKSVNGFRLKGAAKSGVMWCGRLVSDATLDAEMVEWLKQTNFPNNLWCYAED